jgi:transposase-like protein
VERPRRFGVEQKLAVLAEAMAPGANISTVARRHGLLPAQVYKWRRLAELGVIGVPGASELPSFVAVEITKDVSSLPAPVLEDKPATADDTPGRGQRKKAGLTRSSWSAGAGFESIGMSTRRHWRVFSTCWRGDESVASGRPDRVSGSRSTLPGDKRQRVADQVNDASLHRG